MTDLKHRQERFGSFDEPSALRRCVGDVDRFAADWGVRASVYRTGESFEDLLSIDAVIEFLELTARRPTFRMVRNGAAIAPSQYTKTVRMGGTSLNEVADVDRIGPLLDGGATLVLQGLERTYPPLEEFTRALRAELSHPVQANAYLTPVNANGLGLHSDDHDVIALQVCGTKTWQIDGLGTVDVVAGDAIYIPRGCAHAAETKERLSLHITLGISAITPRQIVRRLLDASELDLDRALPIGFANSDVGVGVETISSALAVVADHLGTRDAREVFDAERRRLSRARSSGGRLRASVDAMTVSTVTRFRLSPGTDPRLSIEDDRVVVQLRDRRLTMPGYTSAAMHTIITERECMVEQLPGLDPASRLVLVRRLLRERVIELAPA